MCVAVFLAQASVAQAEPEKNSPEESTEYNGGESLSGNFLSGRFARAQGDRANAMVYLEDALRQDPENAALAGQLMVLSLSAGKVEQAVERARALEPVAGHEPLVDLVLAMQSVKNGELDAADAQFTKVFSFSQNALWAPLFNAWAQVGRGALQQPIQPSDILPEGQQAPAFLAYQLALINDLAGFNDLAAQQYELALLDPAKAPFRAVEAAANFYRRQGEKEKLTQLKLDFMNAHPGASALGDSDTAAYVAELMDPHAAAPPARLIADAADGVAEVFFTMASVLYSVDAQQDTLLYLRMALHLRPDFPAAQLLLGGVLEDDGRYAEAAEAYGGVRTTGPLAERALLRKAYMVEKQGRLEEALAMLDEHAKTNGDFNAYVAKGDLLRSRKRYAEAAKAYSRALGALPDITERHWALLFARGACLERTGQWDKAEADLRKSLELNPDQPEVLNYLGYGLLTRDKNVPEARRLIEQAYDLQPNVPHILDSMGWALYKNGELENAVQLLEQAIELLPGDASVNEHLGDAYWQSGRKTEARFQWERALTFTPDAAAEKMLRRKLKEGMPQMAVQAPALPVAHSTDPAGADAPNAEIVN